MFIIGIFGFISSGKTTVSKWFAEQGADVLNVDRLAKQLYQEKKVMTIIKKVFPSVFTTDGQSISINKLRKHCLSSPTELLRLNQIVHPLIKAKVKKWIVAPHPGKSFLVIDAQILFVAGLMEFTNHNFYIKTDLEKIRLRLATQKTQFSDKQIKLLLATQITDLINIQKTTKNFDVIENNNDLDFLFAQLKKNFNSLLPFTK